MKEAFCSDMFLFPMRTRKELIGRGILRETGMHDSLDHLHQPSRKIIDMMLSDMQVPVARVSQMGR